MALLRFDSVMESGERSHWCWKAFEGTSHHDLRREVHRMLENVGYRVTGSASSKPWRTILKHWANWQNVAAGLGFDVSEHTRVRFRV